MSLDPPEAVICDYGKAVHSQRESKSNTGPIPTLAPEVHMDGHRSYDNRIDIWGIGYVCCQILVNPYSIKHFDMTKGLDEARHTIIMEQLSGYARLGPLQHTFIDLVKRMFAWDPANRPTAAEALQHSCFQESGDDISSSDSSPQVEISYSKKPRSEASACIPPQGRKAALGFHSSECHTGDTELASSGDGSPDFDSAEGTSAAWQAFHKQQEVARAQVSEYGEQRKQLLRRR